MIKIINNLKTPNLQLDLGFLLTTMFKGHLIGRQFPSQQRLYNRDIKTYYMENE